MTGPAAKLRTVTRDEADRIARSGLSARGLWLLCAGLVLVPTLALLLALTFMS